MPSFLQGASQAILEATLVDLQEIYETTTQRIAAVLTWRWGILIHRQTYNLIHWFLLTCEHKFLEFLHPTVQNLMCVIWCWTLKGKTHSTSHTHTHTHTHKTCTETNTPYNPPEKRLCTRSTWEQMSCFFRGIGLVIGCLAGGKLSLKLNEHLFVGCSLFLMGTCLFVAPFCGSLWALQRAMSLHGTFTSFLTVGRILHVYINLFPIVIMTPCMSFKTVICFRRQYLCYQPVGEGQWLSSSGCLPGSNCWMCTELPDGQTILGRQGFFCINGKHNKSNICCFRGTCAAYSSECNIHRRQFWKQSRKCLFHHWELLHAWYDYANGFLALLWLQVQSFTAVHGWGYFTFNLTKFTVAKKQQTITFVGCIFPPVLFCIPWICSWWNIWWTWNVFYCEYFGLDNGWCKQFVYFVHCFHAFIQYCLNITGKKFSTKIFIDCKCNFMPCRNHIHGFTDKMDTILNLD